MLKKLIVLLVIIPAVCYSYDENSKQAVNKIHVDTLRIHPIGDSITRGKNGDTYRHYLKKMIRNQMQIEVDFVGSCPDAPDSKASWVDYPEMADSLENDLEHEGWGGIKIHQLTNSSNTSYPAFTIEELVTTYPSDIILLMIGTNDIYFYYQIDTAPARLDTLIRKIVNNSSAHLIVSSIPPTYLDAINNRINAYNTQMESIVNYYHSLGEKITFVDINSRMDVTDLLSDVVHPNSKGYKKIAEGYFEAINSVLTGIQDDTRKTEVPSKFKLYQNYPNPFNSDTTIKFYLPTTTFVTLKLFNIIGEEIKTCISEEVGTGDFKYNFDAKDLASGFYFYKIEAGRFSAVKKLLLVK